MNDPKPGNEIKDDRFSEEVNIAPELTRDIMLPEDIENLHPMIPFPAQDGKVLVVQGLDLLLRLFLLILRIGRSMQGGDRL